VLITFDALVNFRDLGGHPVTGGGTTRSGWAFRSDGVQRATDADLDRLRTLGITRVIDLRTQHERDTDGRVDGRHGEIEVISVPFLDAIVPHNTSEGDLLGIYLHIVRRRQAAIVAATRAMLTSPAAVVVHCTAGKDRTGVLAALLLGAIGVDAGLTDAELATLRAQLHET
jgi:protein-tyrosine phosphatase